MAAGNQQKHLSLGFLQKRDRCPGVDLSCFFSHFDTWTGTGSLSQVNNSPRANVFPAGVANFGKAMYRSLERSTQDTRDGFFCTVPRPHFLGRALIWPGYFGEHILGLFGLHPSSLSKSAGFVFLSGKASLVSISAAILLLRSWHVYFLLEFEFRGKSCVE